ncbi:MAG TPA: NAD(P)H-binding protein [Longimicrobiaceae bacterium]|nr:NAD(P)H-binding protein [Longimicrobiaceae bacterium]
MDVFITGGTGYIGRRLIPELSARGHAVRALARPGSERKLPPGCEVVPGNALDRATFAARVRSGDTFVQLVGTPNPNPRKAAQFRAVDLVSVRESAAAAREAGVAHFVYVSVAMPAPVMRAYLEVRAQGEALVREAGVRATFIRPWYVLGPGHRWPYLLLPWYWLLERLPGTRELARRLGLVTLDDMIAALVEAVENPPDGVRVVTVPEIRRARNLLAAPRL